MTQDPIPGAYKRLPDPYQTPTSMLADEHSFIIDWYVFGFSKQTMTIAQKVTVYKEEQS